MNDELNSIVELFDEQWHIGSRPQLKAFLERVSDPHRYQLAKVLVPIDVQYRRKAGDAIDPASDYGYLGSEFVEIADLLFERNVSVIDQRDAKTSFARSERSANETETYHPDPTLLRKEFASNSPDYKLQFERPFGDYQVLNEIAEHGQGIVYRANHPRLHRQVVIKVCKKSRLAQNQQALLDEAKVLAQLNHPNVATVYDLQFDRIGNPYLVMEYIEGRNLDDTLQESRPTVEETVAMIKSVCDGLHHAHNLGIFHMDLKPTNIVIRGSDRVPKIIDFGLAQLKPAYGTVESNSYGGTYRYMAPEQALAMQKFKAGKTPPEGLDARADVYAMGAILYEMLTGKPLRENSKTQDLALEQAVANHFDTNPLMHATIPKQLANLCLRALATNPADRVGTVAEFASHLQNESAPTNWGNHRVMLTAGALLGCFAVLGAGYSIMNPSRSSQVRDSLEERNPPPSVVTVAEQAADLKVVIYTQKDKNEVVEEGAIGLEQSSAFSGQYARVHVALPKPYYCYLFALNPTEDPKWNVQLCYPERPDQAGELITMLSYPPDNEYFPLTDGIGQQVFVLVTCPQPLRPFSDWKASIGERLKWQVNDTKGVWKYQQSKVQPVFVDNGHDRGQTVHIEPEQFATHLRSLSLALAGTDEEITAIAFPVLPSTP